LHHRKRKGDHFPRLSSHHLFPRVFSSEALRGLIGSFSGFPIGHSIFPAEVLTNEIFWNSTNEMPQSLFQLANHISPYRSNESVRAIYFWPFVEALSFVQSNSNVNLWFFSNLKIFIFDSAFIVTGRVYLVE
jgi:hypothetical protein